MDEEYFHIEKFPAEEPILSQLERSQLLPKDFFFAKYRHENCVQRYFNTTVESPCETCVKNLKNFNFKFRYCDFGICEDVVKFPALYCYRHNICAKESCSQTRLKYFLYCDYHANLEFQYFCIQCKTRVDMPRFNAYSDFHYCNKK